jgi:hypothetical protein
MNEPSKILFLIPKVGHGREHGSMKTVEERRRTCDASSVSDIFDKVT